MKVLYIATECKPFSKVGGVGDVAGELPIALLRLGVDIEVVTPLYEGIDTTNFTQIKEYKFAFHGKNEIVQIFTNSEKEFPVPINFIRNSTYFEGKYASPYIYSEHVPFYDDTLRFSFFSEACLQLIEDKQPDIVHVNDWPLGYLLGKMSIEGLPQKRVLTIHNIGYQGNIGIDNILGWEIEKLLKDKSTGNFFLDPHEEWNSINALRLGLEVSHKVNTVSPTYCQEITRPESQDAYFSGGKGLHDITNRLYGNGKLIGILNGFDYKNDATDNTFNEILNKKSEMKKIVSKPFKSPDSFLIGFVGRAVEQKFKLLAETIDGKSVLEQVLEIPGINVAILATGLPEYEKFLRSFTGKDNCSVSIAFDAQIAKQISLGSDIFLMPSLFEPCGITQMESLSNATPPLVRWTGGLVDTVIPHTRPNGTGFGFGGDTKESILRNLITCVQDAHLYYSHQSPGFRELQKRGFITRFLWSNTAREYVEYMYNP